MENSIRLTVELIFTDTETGEGETDNKEIAENVLNALVKMVQSGNELAPDGAGYLTEHIYLYDTLTHGREIKLIHSF